MPPSSIQGTRPATEHPAGRDTATLGPGDSSDSGSDMMGISASEGSDPGLPTDIALGNEQSPLPPSVETLTTADDAVGTGERRSAGGDGGRPDGWDIGVDRVFTPEGTQAPDGQALDSEEHDSDLAYVNQAAPGDAAVEGESDHEVDAAEGDTEVPGTPR